MFGYTTLSLKVILRGEALKNIIFKLLLHALFLTIIVSAQDYKANAFAINNGVLPLKSDYSGTLFQFHHNYPTEYIKAISTPWSDVLKGRPLSKKNAHAYVLALKKHVKKSLKSFLDNPEKWNSSRQRGWYSMLWAGDAVEKTGWEGRDAIYGTYTGQIMAKEVYAKSGLTVDIRNHAGIYYNEIAAYTLHRVWQKCDKKTKECIPSVEHGEAQFAEGSIIVKAAGVTATPEQWPVLKGAAKWQVYRKPFDLNGTIVDEKPRVTDLRVGIFDIIIKDSVASPKTGWVFSTLVYDSNASGDSVWDRMVPLGAIWGNDPDVNSAKYPNQELMENYINPNAPAWTKVTLGYGGRMAGPFDIAVKYNVKVGGKNVTALPSSSCLSCHGTSSYISNNYHMSTFLYPAKDYKTKPWKMYTPGSAEWNEWFQDRAGDEPQSKEKGAIALDYSTFLEAAIMNYAAENTSETEISKDMFLKWKAYRNFSSANSSH